MRKTKLTVITSSSLVLSIMLIALDLKADHLPDFTISKFFNEQICTYKFGTDVSIQINAPAPDSMDVNRPTSLILFALPNGNTTAWTIGKEAGPNDDWHYEIQHIGAQTRFMRNLIKDKNIVIAYLENNDLSWPAWRARYVDNSERIINIVQSVRSKIEGYEHKVVLTGHSGGGSLTFGFLNGCDSIPDYIDRISFLDSDYAYSDASHHGEKLAEWLSRSENHYLCTIAYNDSIALYNGAPIVSATGGTWYRSKMMQRKLAEYFEFSNESNSEFLQYFALNRRIQFRLKENPTRAILHTVQVERNGFIQAICSGTEYEEVGYQYYGNHAYDQYVEKLPPENIQLLSLMKESDGSIHLKFRSVPHGEQYAIYIGTDGVHFPDTTVITDSTTVLTGLASDSLYFIKMRATSPWGQSDISELMAVTGGSRLPEVLIVNGYDKIDNSNTGEFIRQHATAFHQNGHSLISASNDALAAGIVRMNDYKIVDFFAGLDIYLDETISEGERALFSSYLENGGNLLYSGMNIAYDMISRGRDYEKEFCWNYMKLDYVNRSPLSAIATYSQVEFMPGTPFGADSFYFDVGTQGILFVDRPNTMRAINGSEPFLKFSGVDTSNGVAGICFSGMFPSGIEPGKIVVTSIPIESIYPDEARAEFIEGVMNFFNYVSEIESVDKPVPLSYSLYQNYPNPFNPVTNISFEVPLSSNINLSVYNILGNITEVLVNEQKEPGKYTLSWNASHLSSGLYYYILKSGKTTITRKCILLK
ncbi:MAG: T9SS type A sorting domain-containing protein [Candidatus Marinimicrobia bacterium]|nr:T9SS type A sorting domain-containing protein [Candidatus Neomarinimicrobiota bacterium]